MSRFAKLATNTFKKLTLGAGVIASDFAPATGTLTVANIIGATSGGINFTDTPTFKDFGEDIDNCAKNTMQLKRITSREIKISGTFATIDTATAKSLMAAADIDGTDTTKVVPRMELKESDFDDLWFICDYSDDISSATGGYVAIHLMNTLATGGFQLQTTDEEKGKMSFEYTAHYDYDDPDTVPYEVYIKAGTANA